MHRFLRWLTLVNAFRIGLATGLFFSLVHLWQVAARQEIPVLTKMENAMVDVRFHQRGRVDHPDRVVLAAVDEQSIARYGRFPWDRRVIASLVDKLVDEGAAAIGFDMSFSDEDLGGRFAGAKRYRKRFEDISLASPRGRAAVDRFSEAEGEIAGAASALGALAHKVKPGAEPIYKTAKGRLEDGKQKINDSKAQFEAMVQEHDAYAKELDQDLVGLDPDAVLGKAVARAGGKVVLGFVALTEPEMRSFKEDEIEEHVKRIEMGRIGAPEFRWKTPEGAEMSKPVAQTWMKAYPGLRAPLAPIGREAARLGFFNTLPDPDGVIRHAALAIQARGRFFPSLDAALVAVYLGIPSSRIIPVVTSDVEGGGDLDGVDFDGKMYVPTDARGLMPINYYGGDRTFTNYSIADVIEGKTPTGALRGKVVLIGATAQGTFDQRVTPFQKITSGVETHANAIETMLSKRFLSRDVTVQAVEVLCCLLLALLFAFIFARVKVAMSLPVLVISAGSLYAASFVLFRLGYDVFVALPLVELGAMFVLVTVYRYATEERDKRQLRKAFQLYLNPEVMEEMLEQPEKLQLGGKELELTVLFSDIRGFTTISEKLSPQALVHLMNEYLSPMTDIVFRRRGTLDKYIGDAVMAFFGAPVQNEMHAANCCDAALEMLETLARLREKWRIEDPNIPDVDIGIGINSGPMVVGNMGSSQRFNYTVMGDNVNLASRLEGLNKEYGTHILVTDQTLTAARKGLKDKNAYTVRELDAVRVKGKKEPVRVFELRSRGVPQTEEQPLLEGYAEGLRMYRVQKFAEARLQFESLLLRYPGDGPSELFIRRCDMMMEAPPGQDWDGVFKMEQK